MLCKIDKFLNSLYRFSGYVASFFLILILVTIVIGIASRIFGFYIRGLTEYSGYSLATASFLALAYTFNENGHIRITLFLERAKGVLLKYKELIRDAQRDEDALIDLENKLIVAEINQAKIDDPWQLITEPTLLKMPVGPKRKNIGFTGLIFGFLISSLFSFLKEKKSGKVFDFKIVRELLSSPLIEEIDIENNISKIDNIFFLKKFIKSKPGKKVYLITLGEREMSFCKKLAEFLLQEEKLSKEIKVLNSSINHDDFVGDETILLMLSNENTKYLDLEILKKRLKLLNIKLTGFLLLKN